MSSRQRGSSWGRQEDRSELPDYYAVLGVPTDADAEAVRTAYHRLALRYHPDIAGDEGVARMKEINRAYTILADPDKRRAYDRARAGILDFRSRSRRPARPEAGDAPVSMMQDHGLLYTSGPLRPGPGVAANLGSISALAFSSDGHTLAIASWTPEVALWQPHIASSSGLRRLAMPAARDGRPDAIRRLRFGPNGLVAGWGHAQLVVWNPDGTVRLVRPLGQPRLTAPEITDVCLADDEAGCRIALPQALQMPMIPWDLGPRGTDVLPLFPPDPAKPQRPLRCSERPPAERRYWAIRLRVLAASAPILLTLSCVRATPNEPEIVILRHWDLAARSWLKQPRPRVICEIEAGRCAEIGAPYAISRDASLLACMATPNLVRVYEVTTGAFDQLPAGPLGAFAHLALADDGSAIAVAREDSEATEGVVELWSVPDRVSRQRLVHPSRVGALAFAPDHRTLAVGQANGSVQIWSPL